MIPRAEGIYHAVLGGNHDRDHLAYGIDNKNDNRQFKLHLSFGPEF